MRQMMRRATPLHPPPAQENVRWIDRYTQPGQHVAVRYAGGNRCVDDVPPAEVHLARRLFALASSPYDVRAWAGAAAAALAPAAAAASAGQLAAARPWR